MNESIEEILNKTLHRPFGMPKGNWTYYQEWNKALFLHWEVPFELLKKCVPSNLSIDTFEGKCYISLVAFTMEKIRPKYFPSVSLISDFDEINIRTYIDNNNKKGVYFLNIEAGKIISTFLAKAISGLPYEKSKISRNDKVYKSENSKKHFKLYTEFNVGDNLKSKTDLAMWLTERYCLYLDKDSEIYRYDIHHKEWELKSVNIKELQVTYTIGEINLSERKPDSAHYSEGIKVIAWKRKKL
ncbi:YqjF family protein [Pedobacter boryungensis]|uniref:DUF2071 domain-containing protein n=1 Tax=Pedobacter boryungensis TaxID=869962 RepID=A0ABX2DFM9_9SPHI|nr:DUF2071 domain-containing protein [Pedobacter boryungensis]NQX32288.1 DUF2071 domain-containing protein [Pedobacter boryungensis]